ncbi:MAG: hypothetical protein KDA93_23860, partial [Planctomycetaceae bacterium]|nr:hypothetical protein [Planctomycetaceae bacterium]
MSAPATDLIHAYLDETLTAEQHVELANWIKASPEHARQFSETVLLHDRLRAEMLAGDMLENQHAVFANRRSSERMWVRRVVALSSALCLTLVLGLIFWQSV